MIGMNRETGRALSGIDHLRQSITDILTTPLGARIMRREYGSRLFELTDAPMNQSTLIEIYSATIDALSRWEPRFKVESVNRESSSENGKIEISISGHYMPTGKLVTLDGIVL